MEWLKHTGLSYKLFWIYMVAILKNILSILKIFIFQILKK